MSDVKKDFEARFHPDETELLILTKETVNGAGVCGKYLIPSLAFWASVDIKTGELSEKRGQLQWLIKNTPDRKGWGYDFKQFKIYHIKARKSFPKKLEPYMDPIINNCYMVTEVIDDNATDSRLEAMDEKLSRPVHITVDNIGSFELNRTFSFFEGEINWLGKSCLLSLDTDDKDSETADQAISVLRQLYAGLNNWDTRLRQYAAAELTANANEWNEEDDEPGEPITEEIFARRLKISELAIMPNGEFSVYYDDDDMFWGHVVIVSANINGEMYDAQIAG